MYIQTASVILILLVSRQRISTYRTKTRKDMCRTSTKALIPPARARLSRSTGAPIFATATRFPRAAAPSSGSVLSTARTPRGAVHNTATTAPRATRHQLVITAATGSRTALRGASKTPQGAAAPLEQVMQHTTPADQTSNTKNNEGRRRRPPASLSPSSYTGTGTRPLDHDDQRAEGVVDRGRPWRRRGRRGCCCRRSLRREGGGH
jgi:hypothetical protein